MKITEVRVQIPDETAKNERLLAFCNITFDDALVVGDVRIIEGTKGLFVAMPSRKLADHCPHCKTKNHLRANHCNNCGGRLRKHRAQKDANGREILYADIAFPATMQFRAYLEEKVLAAYDVLVCQPSRSDTPLQPPPI